MKQAMRDTILGILGFILMFTAGMVAAQVWADRVMPDTDRAAVEVVR